MNILGWKIMTTCRKCVYLELNTKRVMKNNVYQCIAPEPEVEHMLPFSITSAYGYQKVFNRSYITPDREHTCPIFEERFMSE